MPAWTRRWLERHRHPACLALHAVGIPMLPAAAVVLILAVHRNSWDHARWAVELVVVSYALQWAGHRIEGNDMGEVILVKKLFGRPYVAVAPRYQRPAPDRGPTPERMGSARNESEDATASRTQRR